MNNVKSVLRHYYINKRLFLSEYERSLKSKIINKKIILFLKKIKITGIATFFAIKGEPDLSGLSYYLIKNKIDVFFPRVKGKTMSWVKFNGYENGELNRFGIWEPKGTEVNRDSFNVMLIPAVSYDIFGNRLGFGGGYYDRNCIGFNGVKIGVCFDELIHKKLPFERHDIKVDYVFTEKRNLMVNENMFSVANVMKRR